MFCTWFHCFYYWPWISLREKCPNKEFFLVRIFPHSNWIRRDTSYLYVFSPNAGKYGSEKTPYLDTFHAVKCILKSNNSWNLQITRLTQSLCCSQNFGLSIWRLSKCKLTKTFQICPSSFCKSYIKPLGSRNI